jgi:hypothetical protein
VALVWSGHDAFDELGTRVATVARYRDFITGPDVFVPTTPYWNAFVAHEYVLVDGVPGRWTTESEAKAAAVIAYRAYIGAAADGSSPGDPSRIPPVDRPPSQPRGVGGHLRSLYRSWRLVRGASADRAAWRPKRPVR